MTTSNDAHQREVGGFAVANWKPQFGAHALSATASIRADSFRTFDALQTASNTAVVTHLPEENELFASPHLGIVYDFRKGAALTANTFRALSRAPR